MGTGTAPADHRAKSATVHSYRVRLMMPTASPCWTPAAMSPLARAETSAANVAAVTSVQPSAERTEKDTRPGSALAHRSGRSARLPSVVAGGTRGVGLSWTGRAPRGPGGGGTPQL